jgi:hypothetical protein
MRRRKHVCDWPGCTEKTANWIQEGWANCCSHGDIPFLADPCLLCPTHGRAYEDLACNEQPPTTSAH